MLISLITAIAVGGITYSIERAIDRTVQQGKAIKDSGGSIRKSLEATAAGMTYAATQMQPPVPQQTPAPVVYDDDEFDDDDVFYEDNVEQLPAEEVEVIEEPKQEQPAPAPEPPSGKSKKGKK